MIEYENLFASNKVFMEEYRAAFEKVLNSGWFILGDSVSNFEKEFAEYCNTNYCIGVASGLDALTLSLHSLNLPRGSEVIVPSNTYIATILSIVHLGLKPILVEPDIRTYNIDTSRIVEAITNNTKAIMVVHLYGKCCDMANIMEIAHENGLYVIEDCAQSHGASQNEVVCGSFGDFGAFSFYPTKNLGALGDAGAVTTQREDYANIIKKLRNYGSSKKYYNEVIGHNSRLHELQAAFLSIKLKKMNEITEHKRNLANIYLEKISDDFIKPKVEEGYYDVYHIFNIRTSRRDELKDFLLKNEIKTDIHYPVAPNKQQAMIGILDHFDTSIAEEIHRTTLSLPISYGHSSNDIETVCDAVNYFAKIS